MTRKGYSSVYSYDGFLGFPRPSTTRMSVPCCVNSGRPLVANTRKILTLHSPIGPHVVDELLTAIEKALHRVGAERVWIDPRSSHDLTILADLPELTLQDDGLAEVPDPRSLDDDLSDSVLS